MPELIFIEYNGIRHRVEASVGESVMAAASRAMIPGILADCGGSCSCATCRAYVEPGIFPDRDGIEEDMLQCVLEPREDSRLTCQLTIAEGMDGVEIRLPEHQV